VHRRVDLAQLPGDPHFRSLPAPRLGQHVGADRPSARRFVNDIRFDRTADILVHAYRLARVNAGAPGVDGMTFARIEEQGLEAWLAGLTGLEDIQT
jgi:hypothetical protein